MLLCTAAAAHPVDNWPRCAEDGGVCRVESLSVVVYGLGIQWAARVTDKPIACKSAAFAVPDSDGRFECRILPASAARLCAPQGGICNITGTAVAVYGADTRYTAVVVSQAFSCTNPVMGDPAPGVQKACYVAQLVEARTPLPPAKPAAER